MENKVQRKWDIKSAEGTVFEFLPIFGYKEATDQDSGEMKGEIECHNIQIKIKDKTYTFNYLNLYMFMYFVSNEELRQKLMQRYEKQVYEIPYDVTFKITKEEKEEGIAKRRIKLKIDEIAMAMVRSEANFFRLKNPELMRIMKGK